MKSVLKLAIQGEFPVRRGRLPYAPQWLEEDDLAEFAVFSFHPASISPPEKGG